jgi:hypothetical protein
MKQESQLRVFTEEMSEDELKRNRNWDDLLLKNEVEIRQEISKGDSVRVIHCRSFNCVIQY